MSAVPEGLNPKIETREIVFDASVDLVTPFPQARDRQPRWHRPHDVRLRRGAEPRRARLGAHATHVFQRRARVLTDDPGVPVRAHAEGHGEGMRMKVTARYRVDGSVLNDTVQGRMVGAETTLEIDSPDPPERVAKVVRNAERGCFVLQALQNPVPVTGRNAAQRRGRSTVDVLYRFDASYAIQGRDRCPSRRCPRGSSRCSSAIRSSSRPT